MKKFIKKTIYILLPIILIYILIELFISYYPNTFNTKAKHLNSNLENIEILFLGSSHTQNGINPKFIDISSSNIAYGGQDFQLNKALYFKYISRLKKIKKIVIELDYHSLEQKNNTNYFRLPWYYKYHDVNLGKFKPYNKVSLFISNPYFFKKYLNRTLNPINKKFTMNKFGFIENDFGLFKKLNYDKEIIIKSSSTRLKNRHNLVSIANYELNKKILKSIIDDCISRNIEVIILKTPQYLTYRNNYNKSKLKRRKVILDSLLSIEKIKVLDFEMDIRFNLKDFKNDDHLNSKGAEKLSKLINKKINTWK